MGPKKKKKKNVLFWRAGGFFWSLKGLSKSFKRKFWGFFMNILSIYTVVNLRFIVTKILGQDPDSDSAIRVMLRIGIK
jgi:hypothetical protein